MSRHTAGLTFTALDGPKALAETVLIDLAGMT
jgi:hypothetical protein